MNRMVQSSTRVVLTLLITAASGCNGSQPGTDREAVRDSILSLVNRFRRAELELNSEKFAALNEQSPEFTVYTDNNTILDYDQMVEANRRVFHRLKRMQLQFDTIHIRMLAPDMGVAFGPFQQALTDSLDNTTRVKGQVLWIARRINGQWKFVFAQAFHRPDTTSSIGQQ